MKLILTCCLTLSVFNLKKNVYIIFAIYYLCSSWNYKINFVKNLLNDFINTIENKIHPKNREAF